MELELVWVKDQDPSRAQNITYTEDLEPVDCYDV